MAERPQAPAAARLRSPPHGGELRQVQRHPHTRGGRGVELPLRADFRQLLQQVSLNIINISPPRFRFLVLTNFFHQTSIRREYEHQ